MKKIRILFTIPNFDTAGSGKALLGIATGLDPKVFEVEVMCLHGRGNFFKVVENSGLRVHIYNFTPKPRPVANMLKECWRVSRKFREIAPHIIHSYHYGPNYTEALAARMAGIPWVFTKKNMNWGGKSANAWKLRSFLATKIAVQNTQMWTEFYKTSKKIVLIPRGVDVAHFKAGTSRAEEKQEFSKTSRNLICVANFLPLKGIEILVQAFEKIAVHFSNWNLILVGDNSGSYGDGIKELAGGFGLGQRIVFTGKQLDVRPFLNTAEIFVFPSKSEGSPVAILEAMANGKVVLASDIPGIRDQMAPFPNCLFPADDIDGLKVKLQHYMEKDREELRDLGESFYAHVQCGYALEKEIESHANLYKTLMQE